MNMRGQFVNTMESLIKEHPQLTLLLGDIGVFGFRNSLKNYPERAYNIGILEQSTISLAAGLAKTNMVPVVYTIAPFLIERCFEQLKIEFGYQKLGGNFVSVGASYDYAALGCTHHCPADVQILKNIPGMQIVLPGTSHELDLLFRQVCFNSSPTYMRLSEQENSDSYDVEFGKAVVVKKGDDATVIAVGPILRPVSDAVKDMNVTLLYYTTVSPFDVETLQKNCRSSKVILCEPYYEGGLAYEICTALKPRPVSLNFIGVPHKFLTNYGKSEEHDKNINLDAEAIQKRIEKIIYE